MTVVFVKLPLTQYVIRVDTSSTDQVWMQFTFMAGVMFAFCFVPPLDPSFFDPLSYSHIHEKLQFMEMERGYVLIGNFNARFGRCAAQFLPAPYFLSGNTYPQTPDLVENRNVNAHILGGLCIDSDLFFVNNLKTNNRLHMSGLNYKKELSMDIIN